MVCAHDLVAANVLAAHPNVARPVARLATALSIAQPLASFDSRCDLVDHYCLIVRLLSVRYRLADRDLLRLAWLSSVSFLRWELLTDWSGCWATLI